MDSWYGGKNEREENMSKLVEFVKNNSVRGACTCGKCFAIAQDGSLVKVKDPEKHQPDGHTSDMYFFKVSIGEGPEKEKFEMAKKLRELIDGHKGVFNEVDLFDGNEHGFIEIGGWIGDQGLALQLMGMGALLDLWVVMTPETVMPSLPKDLKKMMAESGMLTIKAKEKK